MVQRPLTTFSALVGRDTWHCPWVWLHKKVFSSQAQGFTLKEGLWRGEKSGSKRRKDSGGDIQCGQKWVWKTLGFLWVGHRFHNKLTHPHPHSHLFVYPIQYLPFRDQLYGDQKEFLPWSSWVFFFLFWQHLQHLEVSSLGQDGILAIDVTSATAVATPDSLTHCATAITPSHASNLEGFIRKHYNIKIWIWM